MLGEKLLAEEVGFEPTDALTPTVFKTVPINRTLAPLGGKLWQRV